jgi:lipopolysaccharide export system protein LptC
MRLTLLLTFLCVALHLPAIPAGEAVNSDLTPETDAKMSAEALARYSAPGQTGRYKALLEALQQNPETMGSPARNLRVPVRSFPDGRPQVMVQAADAWITLDTTLLRGRQVHVEQYREDGTLEAVLDADEIIVNRTTMLAVAKGKVRVERDGDVLMGNGALVDLDANYLRVIKQACITTQRMGEVNLTDRGIF